VKNRVNFQSNWAPFVWACVGQIFETPGENSCMASQMTDVITITLPKSFVKFVLRFYGGFLGVLWVLVICADVYSLYYYQHGITPLWNPVTATAAKLSLTGKAIGFAGLCYGCFRGLKLLSSADRQIRRLFLFFGIFAPVFVLFFSAAFLRLLLIILR